MKPVTLFVVLLFFCVSAYGQDLITIRSGDTIRAKVTRVTPIKIEYKHSEHDKQSFSLPRNMLAYVFYQNGMVDSFLSEGPAEYLANYSESEKLAARGLLDAQTYYKGYRSAKGWTTFLTIYFSPIYGLVPAVAMSGSKPSIYNLDVPNKELMDYESYRNAYEKQAFQIKKREVWRGYRTGTFVYIGIAAVFLSMLYAYHY